MPSTSSARPLFLTDDPALLDDLLRLAAAANVDVTVVSSAARSSRYWAQAPLVVVGTDLVGVLARAEPPRHAHAVVVSRTPLSPALDFSVYPDAMRIGARDVLVLPDAEQQLVALLTESTDHAGEEALVVSVIGGRGGAGASLLAAALALAGHRAGLRTALVDADPLGGGLDILLGAEHVPGSRWEEFSNRQGRMLWPALRDSLPHIHGLPVVTWTRHGPYAPIPPQAMRTVLHAATRGCQMLVVDLPRALDAAAEEVLRRTTVALMILPAEVSAVVAAERLLPALRDSVADLRLVVRGATPDILSAESVASSLKLPLAGDLPDDTELPRLLDQGELPTRRTRSPLVAFSEAFVAHLCPERVRSA